MAATFPLVARTTLTYHGRELRPGETFQATAPEAAALTHNKQADFVDPKQKAPRKPRARTYRRRDLQAEHS